ncbi:hypothetical protein ABEF95_011754 [Exophiala dermatitidis]|uniref:Uncharacterized protein n=1 Tax=Exophiala dermatitidis (strain ATCC 34100 / CBS 525.76 / NIH/UT8656) TaxID=858893 RepID=H6C5T6_EXODN|nr:uncharacterized protein HMPREF1120_07081 [Exophiala dermatitidis NIH/UT8656]EHY59082.1 hypothetical protein HMPREF1120_07081 [Exophiala dermatitidis NIH/UT8656]
MRAESTNSKWANVDKDFTSSIWDEGLQASQVFIIPTITTGQGTRELLEIVEKGSTDLTTLLQTWAQIAGAANEAETRYNFSWVTHFTKVVAEHAERGTLTTEDEFEGARREALLPFTVQAANCLQICKLAEGVLAGLATLHKIASGLLAEQETQKEELVKTEEGVKRLTVCIKCVDAVWADITRTWRACEALKGHVQREGLVAVVPREAEEVAEAEEVEG